MLRSRLRRMLSSDATVSGACAATFALGLFFVFVWAPHPWGWEGFDHYHQLALTLAAGQPFPTMDVPWGYAYFAAAFYRTFGDRPWIVLLVQVLLNASVPWLVYRFAATWTDRRTARLAAVVAAMLSFNTIYTSTQSSDAVCTVIFMTAVVAFAAALRRDGWRRFGAVGLLTGIAAQFRPNLILVPVLLAAYAVLESRTRRRVLQAALMLACAAAALAPWVARNYLLTRTLLPTSVHGGVQLWYGTLQVGPYLHSRAYNPRAVFETPVFDYTSLDAVPIVVSAHANPCVDPPSSVALVYWFDRDHVRHRLAPAGAADGRFEFQIPATGQDAVIYYYFDATWPGEGGPATVTTPPGGEAAPFVYFVAHNHLGDLDVHGDLLDIFDLVRLARHVAFGEPLTLALPLAQAGIRSDDVERAAEILGRAAIGPQAPRPLVASLDRGEGEARLTFHDGSSIVIPRTWSGRITDLTFSGAMALALMGSRVSLASLARAGTVPAPTRETLCAQLSDVAVNGVFYRREPHQMHRYSALAFDNIRRDLIGFVRASGYRAVRVFVIQGSDDRATSQQFSSSPLIYRLATLATVAYLAAFAAGAVVAWRRGDAVVLPLLLVAYVPVTIAPVLTNMRYSVTVQPVVFIFIAAALTALLERAGLLTPNPAARGRAGTRTAPGP